MAAHDLDVQGSESPCAALTDRFGRVHRYLRVSLTDRCNYRCRYCTPLGRLERRAKDELLSLEEIHGLVRLFVDLGVDKVRLTGGEPSVRKGYVDLVSRLSGLPGLRTLAMTTNGTRLAQDAGRLSAAGLQCVNVSLDSLRPRRFAEITRGGQLEQVLDGIEAAIEAGLTTKVNVVVLAGTNDDEILDFVEYARDMQVTVRFIEFMPFLDNGWRPNRVVSSAEVLATVTASYIVRPVGASATAVADEYTFAGSRGRIGFVSSVTDSFCDGCNRLRLTAEGRLKSCLFLPPGPNLRDLVRSSAPSETMVSAIRKCLAEKWPGHPPMSRWRQLDTLSMVEIGG